MKSFNKKRKPKNTTRVKYLFCCSWYAVTNFAKAKGVYENFTEQVEKIGRYQQIVL